ncbi:hypothetical protein Tco_0349497 [Tanacetum coccineum]
MSVWGEEELVDIVVPRIEKFHRYRKDKLQLGKTKDTLSSCSDLDEQEIQQLQKQAKILKENSLNKLNALQTTIQHLSSSNYSMHSKKETLPGWIPYSGLSIDQVQFDNFIHSRVLELSNSNSHALEITQDFKAYTNMEAQTFKETIIQNIDVTPRLGGNTRHNIMDIITTQWCQQ